MHYIRKSLIYSSRKAFLEHTVAELVYKFDGKSTTSVRKVESTAKVPFKLFLGSYIYIRECGRTLYIGLMGMFRMKVY